MKIRLGSIFAALALTFIATSLPATTRELNRTLASWPVPSTLKVTTGMHDGAFANNANGYSAMYQWIQKNGCEGYHVCDSREVTAYLQANPSFSLETYSPAWFNGGAESSNHCGGWNSNEAADTASVFNQYMLTQAPCDNSFPVLCCK